MHTLRLLVLTLCCLTLAGCVTVSDVLTEAFGGMCGPSPCKPNDDIRGMFDPAAPAGPFWIGELKTSDGGTFWIAERAVRARPAPRKLVPMLEHANSDGAIVTFPATPSYPGMFFLDTGSGQVLCRERAGFYEDGWSAPAHAEGLAPVPTPGAERTATVTVRTESAVVSGSGVYFHGAAAVPDPSSAYLPRDDGKWHARVILPRGTHELRYVVPPAADRAFVTLDVEDAKGPIYRENYSLLSTLRIATR